MNKRLFSIIAMFLLMVIYPLEAKNQLLNIIAQNNKIETTIDSTNNTKTTINANLQDKNITKQQNVDSTNLNISSLDSSNVGSNNVNVTKTKPKNKVAKFFSNIPTIVYIILAVVLFLLILYLVYRYEKNKRKSHNSSSPKIKDEKTIIKKLDRIEENISQLDSTLKNINHKITQNENNIKENEQKNLEEIKKEKDKISRELESYKQKTIEVVFLQEISKSMLNYYNFCKKEGLSKANDFLQKLESNGNKEESYFVSQFINKCYSTMPSNSIDNWIGVLKEIEVVGLTTKNEVIKHFKQIKNVDQKKQKFLELLNDDLFMPYTSSILIFAEEMSNLSKFNNVSKNYIVEEIETYYTKFKNEVRNKIKVLNLNLQDALLFENLNKFIGVKVHQIQCNNSFLYNNIDNLKEHDILEIIEYGFGNNPTKVILKINK